VKYTTIKLMLQRIQVWMSLGIHDRARSVAVKRVMSVSLFLLWCLSMLRFKCIERRCCTRCAHDVAG
jgi:hypothetical protein